MNISQTNIVYQNGTYPHFHAQKTRNIGDSAFLSYCAPNCNWLLLNGIDKYECRK